MPHAEQLHEGAVYRSGEEVVWAVHTVCCALQGVSILAFGLLGDVLGGTRLLWIGGSCFYCVPRGF
jgi:hypothetical protein